MGEKTLPTAMAAEFKEFLSCRPLLVSPHEHVFGFEHQCLLRIHALLQGDQADLEERVFEYWQSTEARERIAEECRRLLNRIAPASAADSGTHDLMIDTETSWSHYTGFAERHPEHETLRIKTDYGVAEYPVLQKVYDVGRGTVYVPRGPYLASLGMLMFYGFAVEQGRAVLQPLPITLIAATDRRAHV